MANSLSNLVNNLAERIQRIRYRHRHDNATCVELNAKIEEAVSSTQTLKMI